MTGQVNYTAALGNYQTPRSGSTETEQPGHRAGCVAALDPLPRRAAAGGTSALHPGPASASDGAPTQNHYLLSHPKAVVQRPTCPLGPPLHCPLGRDRSMIPEWGAGGHALPHALAPALDSWPLMPPGCPDLWPRGQLALPTAWPCQGLAAPGQETQGDQGGRWWSRLQHLPPNPHPGQKGSHSKTAPSMPAQRPKGDTHTHFASCPATEALRAGVQLEPSGSGDRGLRIGLLLGDLGWPQFSDARHQVWGTRAWDAQAWQACSTSELSVGHQVTALIRVAVFGHNWMETRLQWSLLPDPHFMSDLHPGPQLYGWGHTSRTPGLWLGSYIRGPRFTTGGLKLGP